MTLYRIAGWDKHFEIYDAKRVDGPLKWIAVPTKTDGYGFSRIRLEKDAPQLLAAWYLMLGVAAKQERKDRGKLQRDGIPLTAIDLELITGFPAKIFERAFWFYSQPKQGWLVAEDLPINPASCAQVAPSCAPTLQDRTLQDMTVGRVAQRRAAGAAPAAQSDAEWLASLGQNPAYQGINIGAEYGKMQAWCGANRKQPSRRRFINWLNRCERPMPRAVTIAAAPKPSEPANWRATLKRLYPDANDDLSWATLPESIKAEINQETP